MIIFRHFLNLFTLKNNNSNLFKIVFFYPLYSRRKTNLRLKAFSSVIPPICRLRTLVRHPKKCILICLRCVYHKILRLSNLDAELLNTTMLVILPQDMKFVTLYSKFKLTAETRFLEKPLKNLQKNCLTQKLTRQS